MAIRALREGRTKYTLLRDQAVKRGALCKYRREQGLEYKPEEVIIVAGAKHALYNVFQVLCGPVTRCFFLLLIGPPLRTDPASRRRTGTPSHRLG